MTRRRRGARPPRRSGAPKQKSEKQASPEEDRLLARSRDHLETLDSPDHSHRLIADDLILEALKKTGGRVWAAARLLRISPRTIWRRIGPEQLAEIRADHVEDELDRAELELKRKVQNGDWKAIRFLLLTRGKSRGYVFGQEVKVSGGVVHATLDQVLTELEQDEGWHEFCRTTEANRYSGLLGDERQPAGKRGGGPLDSGKAPAGGRPTAG